MTSAIRKSVRVALLGLLMVVGGEVRQADAAPILGVQYVEIALGGGLFQYDYVLSNLGDPVTDAGFDVWDIALFLPPTTSLVSWATPSGWDLISGSGFVNTFSFQPGASPAGADIGPGQSLSGFTFVFDSAVGSVPFSATFVDPNDPANGLVYGGVTAPAQAVPEPSSLLLFGTGALGWFVVARRRTRSSAPGA